MSMRNMRNIGTMRRTRLPNSPVEVSRYPGLSRFGGISHFVTSRAGGVSERNYASMNLGLYSGDRRERVDENIRRLMAGLGLGPERLLLPRQVHGCRVAVVDKTFTQLSGVEREARLEGFDALVTADPGVCVAVATADCVPILLYAPDKRVVAAVHAGWRGTVARIAERTVQRMADAFGCDPRQVWAAIGPSIGPAAFEVGEEVVDAFRDAGFDLSRLLLRDPDSGKGHIDLWRANRMSLAGAGLEGGRIELAGICTYERFNDYFSARRLGVRSGRFLSGIFIDEAPIF